MPIQPPEPLHPLLQAEADERRRRPPLASLGVEDARIAFQAARLAGPAGPKMSSTAPMWFETPAGATPARPRAERDLPMIVYFHGGGFVLGRVDTHDLNARRLAAAAGSLVLSVDYRLAPEHPFPAAADDAVNVVEAALNGAFGLGANPRRVFVAGDSAGATLAIVAAASHRAIGERDLAGVVAFYPVADFSNVGGTASYAEFGDGRTGLSTADVIWFRDQYAPRASDRRDPRCSPLLMPDLGGMPDFLIVSAHYDVLRDDASQMEARLRAAGVGVVHHRMQGVNHGFLAAPDDVGGVARAQRHTADWIAVR